VKHVVEAKKVKEDMEMVNYKALREFAFVGRSNVGKSSLINAMLDADIVQASRTPGKTRALSYVHLPQSDAFLVDCPGYGYAKVSQAEKQSWQKLMNVYMTHSQSLWRMIILSRWSELLYSRL